MAEKPIATPLPADLPTNWAMNQIVSPNGTEVGLTQQHGYNYLSNAVNQAQAGVNTLNEAFEDLETAVPMYTITLTSGGWTMSSLSESALAGMYLQQITGVTFKASQKVDIALPPSLMNSIPAGITTANVSGTVYAVTEFPPDIDVTAQITVINVTKGAGS
nr:MAG TPA: hypothetical protein [Caudoviricetes sp.]